jgi:hypothetical protein
MEQLPHNLEFRGTMPRVHVRAHHQSAAMPFRLFRAKVRKSQKTESLKVERKKWISLPECSDLAEHSGQVPGDAATET